MKIKEIVSVLEEYAPKTWQESYDNSGLLIGEPDQEIDKALITLDLTMEVLEEAMKADFGLIISHHPLIFSGLKSLTGKSEVERIVMKAVKHDVGIYAIHTNLDNVLQGVNGMLSRKLGIENPRILRPLQGQLSKLVTFCPLEHAGSVREALFSAGAGHIGNYDSCSYNLEGFGTFRAGEGTDPFVGEKGELHKEAEARIEVIFPDHIKSRLLKSMMNAHPYEEVAYDIYPLKNDLPAAGAGVIGNFSEPMDEAAFISLLKTELGSPVIRHSKFIGKKVRTVAACGGSGSFLIRDAIASGADAFITGDMKYHQFFEAEGKLLIADAGHYETEQFTKELIYNILNEKFPTFALRISHINTNAVHYM
ncbi:MAG: Nif3-like dinuclear metal center hexameric protein [Bacteroidales bacterium]|jgi:dinuclear metal center YbgI/SA1388 family protein|nr:Nif3-like dinuclear metal center hexameric protein [Bacteroidales bacterium]